jgi:putative zinc finger/helix-turn-helix YgiT family protein
MNCVHCDSSLRADLVELTGPYRGREVRVQMNGLRCDNCGFVTVRGRDMPEFRNRIKEAFREEEQLLQGSELQVARKEMRATQEAFASFLEIGVASVKRIEAGGVPERLLDEHVRMRLYPERMEVILQDRLWNLNLMKGALAELPRAAAQCTFAWKNLAECQSYTILTTNFDAMLQGSFVQCSERIRELTYIDVSVGSESPQSPMSAADAQLALVA